MQPHKGLRIPQSWNDKTLLLDEPFLTSFVVRQLASAARGRGNLADKSIAKDVLKDSREAVQAWLNIAFKATEKETRNVRKLKINTKLENVEIFVRVYWCLHQKDEQGARIILNQERKKKGFGWDLVVEHEKREETRVKLEALSRSHSRLADKNMDAEPKGVDAIPPEPDAGTSSTCRSSVLDASSLEEVKVKIASSSSDEPPLVPMPDIPIPVEPIFPIQQMDMQMEADSASLVRKRASSLEDRRSDISDEDKLPLLNRAIPVLPSPVQQKFLLKSAAIFPPIRTQAQTAPAFASEVVLSAPTDARVNTETHVAEKATRPSLKKQKRHISDDAPSNPDHEHTGHMPSTSVKSIRRASARLSSVSHGVSTNSIQPLALHKARGAKLPTPESAEPKLRMTKQTKVEDITKAVTTSASEATHFAQAKHPLRVPDSRTSADPERRITRQIKAEDLVHSTAILQSQPMEIVHSGKPPTTTRDRKKPTKASSSKTSKSRLQKKAQELPTPPTKRRRTSVEEVHPVGVATQPVVTTVPTFIQQAETLKDMHFVPDPPTDVNTILKQGLIPSISPPDASGRSRTPTTAVHSEAQPPVQMEVSGLQSLSDGQRLTAEGKRDPPPMDIVPTTRMEPEFVVPVVSAAIRSSDILKKFHFKRNAPIEPKMKEQKLLPPDPRTAPNQTSALGKRNRSQTAVIAHVQSELKEMQLVSRPQAELPVRPKHSKAAHQRAPPPPALGKGMKFIDQALVDAGANAAQLLNHNAPSLPNWAVDDVPDFPDSHELDEENIITLRDHEADPRPVLSRYPPIWAQSRQEVCESLDWFRSYHGGVYFSDNIVKGYLLGGFSSSRDAFEHDGRLIISHGGGKSESLHSREGRMENQMAADQLAQDKSVRALLRNYTENRPLVLIADDRFKLFPYNLAAKGCAYVVLGFYCIVNAWAEYHPVANETGGAVRFKFAFQWCESQGDPWWITSSSGGSDSSVSVGPATPLTSSLDKETKAEEYQQLNLATPVVEHATTLLMRKIPTKTAVPMRKKATSDEVFYKCEQCKMHTPQVYKQGWMCLAPECPAFWKMGNGSPAGSQLDYAPSFLKLKPAEAFPTSLPNICPPTPTDTVSEEITTTYAFTKGWHCTKCGRLSSRYIWAYWECAHCKHKISATGRRRGPKEFWSQIDHSTTHRLGCDSGIIKTPSALYDVEGIKGEYIKYILPFGRGTIHLIRGNPRANREADAIFEQYQKEAGTAEKLIFRRFPMRAHKCRGALLTNYFSQNSGEPYQYVGGTDNTVPFTETAEAVNKALELIRTRAQAALQRKPDFNEILSAAYMERQKMAFHSDSERGLGPVVASLSLGSAALMHFRLHNRLRSDDEEAKENALTLTLRHGDVVVMEGAGVQECYEHTVVPCNFRIAATARWIGGSNASTYR